MKEQVSALMDGELDERAAGDAIGALRAEGDALQAWRTYHLISDAMRDSRLLSQSFTARVASRLQAEPTVLAPARLGAPAVRRFALATAASVAAIGLVGWLAFAPQREADAPARLTQAPASAPAPAAQSPSVIAIVPLPSAANDYLLAHQGFSPRVSLQGMAPYVRTVSERADESAK